MNHALEDLREVVPQVLGALARRGADVATAEDAVQEALVEAWQRWAAEAPRDPYRWLVTVARHKLVDAQRSEAARHAREARLERQPPPVRPSSTTTRCSCCSGAATQR